MYRVMIVEDEMLVRMGLKNSINWNNFEMVVVADKPDGQSAWEYYVNHKPDIVITDLNMPVMDGMTLISHIREHDADTKIIILSCLEQFHLVQKAMDLGVSNYILKLTMKEEEIEHVLEKTRYELHKQSKSVRMPKELGNSDLVKEKIFNDFLYYPIYSAEEFEKYVVQAKLNLNKAKLVFCMMEIDHIQELMNKFRDQQGSLIKMTLMNILNEILVEVDRGEQFPLNEKQYAIVLSFDGYVSEQSIRIELNRILAKIKEVIGMYYNVTVSFGISRMYNGYQSLRRMHMEAQKALDYKFLSGIGLVFNLDSIVPQKVVVDSLMRLTFTQELSRYLSDNSITDYNSRIHSFLAGNTLDKLTIKHFLLKMFQWSANTLIAKEEQTPSILWQFSQLFHQSETLDEIVEHYRNGIAEMMKLIEIKRQLSKEVSEAVKFIASRYKQDITLQDVADYVQLSPNYISALMKKELNANFIDYLNDVRIEQAKKLLLGTYLKCYEIAEESGFSEQTYFSKVFKKITGVTPHKFRRQWMSNIPEELDIEDQELDL